MQYETFSLMDAVGIVRPLLQQNFDETGLPGSKFKLHELTYQTLDDARAGFAIVAFDNDGVAGFVSVFLSVHPHTSEITATNDALYVLPKYRCGSVGGSLMARAEREARRKHAVRFLWEVPVGSGIDVALSYRTRYRFFQKTFLKEI